MRNILIAALLITAFAARGDDFYGRALASYENRDSNTLSTSGLRQQYDLHLDRAFTTTSLVRLFCRIDDFRGTQDYASIAQRNRSRQIQPVAEFILNTGTLQAMARGERIDLQSTFADIRSDRRIQRMLGQLTWQPDKLPIFHLLGSRDSTRDDNARIDLTNDNAYGSVQYHWRGLEASAEERYYNSADPAAGYERKSTGQMANLNWSSTHFGGKLAVAAGGQAQLIKLNERSVGGTTTSVPTPQPISRALWTIDDTPLDDRDHPPVVYPSLIDNNLTTSTGISIGPDGASFQNIIIDIGRVDRADEIRVIVRDAAGNPLQHGGGAVTWDVYVSDDGQLWRSVPSARTSFNAPLSLYSIAFDLTTARWLKVVSFGVNADPTLVTEVQAYYHTTLAAGKTRNGTQDTYNGTTTLTFQPYKKLILGYTGVYTALREKFTTASRNNTSDVEHLGTLQYDLLHHFALRGQVLRRTAETFTGRTDSLNDATAFIDYIPTAQLHVTLELGKRDETQQGSTFNLDTKAIHVSAFVIRSVILTADAGVQTQTIALDGGTADHTFFNFTGNLQLAPSLRMLLNGSMQRTKTNSSDPAVQLLGAERDNRVSSEFIWRSGRELRLSARFGWASGAAISGFTQRYHVDWYPFGDGTVSLGGSYDQDIDPTVNRRAKRVIVSPRWMMNRWVILDLNYTSLLTTFETSSFHDRTFFATVTLTK